MARVAAGGILFPFEGREMFVGSSQDVWRPMGFHVPRLDVRVVAGAMHDLGIGELRTVMELLTSYAATTKVWGGGASSGAQTRQPWQTPFPPFHIDKRGCMFQRG